MSDLRSKFKATSAKTLKNQSQSEDAAIGSGGNGEFHVIAEGLNKFRLYPGHEGEPSFMKMRSCWWITIENDEGKEVRRTVASAKEHDIFKKDVIEEYINFCKEQLDASDPDDAAKLKILTDYKKGMSLANTWIGYADKIKKDQPPRFALLEVKKAVRDKLNQEAIIEDEDEAMEVDPYTDVDDGIPILLNYTKTPPKGSKIYYTVKLAKNALPLTDEQLEAFDKVKPLSKLPIFQYNKRDFELALEGLRFYDEAHEINLFETDEFQEIVQELASLVGASTGSDDDDATPKKKGSKKNVEPTRKVSKKKQEEEDEDDAPFDDEEEEEKPKKKTVKKPSKPEPEEEDEDEESGEEDDEEEEEKPAKKSAPVKKKVVKKPEPEEDDEEEAAEDDDEEEEKPAPKKTVKKTTKKPEPEPEDEEEGDEEGEDEEEDEKPAAKTSSLADLKKKLAGMKKK